MLLILSFYSKRSSFYVGVWGLGFGVWGLGFGVWGHPADVFTLVAGGQFRSVVA